jgi:NADH-quinone oxidoreductase subunit B
MPNPKYVVAMGVCASSGGLYRNYAVVPGIDRLVPVDVYTMGCPPRPDTLINALLTLQKKIEAGTTHASGNPKPAVVGLGAGA